MVMLASLLVLLCLADSAALVYLAVTKQSTSKPSFIINLPLIRSKRQFRTAVLSLVMKHYMSHDANLGYRMKANTKPFRMLHRVPGRKKRFKEVSIKNFFEIRTDHHGFISNTVDQKRDYAKLAQDDTVYKVLVCGNSVTTGYGTKSSEYNWPAVLERSLNENLPAGYKEVVVINSASLGSFPAQELRRFQDETIFLNPNMVILFTAGAAAYDYQGNPVDIGFHDEQKKMNQAFNEPWYAGQYYFLPNLMKYLQLRFHPSTKLKDHFPFRHEGYITTNAAQYTLSKVRQFKGICDTHGIEFLFFLQPLMGGGKKTLTKQEENLITHFERYFFNQNWEEYSRLNAIYLSELRTQLTQPYEYDFLDIFEHYAETVYCDPRHQNERGHQIVAEKIEEVVRKHWISEGTTATKLKVA